jgi:hypothetical protein
MVIAQNKNILVLLAFEKLKCLPITKAKSIQLDDAKTINTVISVQMFWFKSVTGLIDCFLEKQLLKLSFSRSTTQFDDARTMNTFIAV